MYVLNVSVGVFVISPQPDQDKLLIDAITSAILLTLNLFNERIFDSMSESNYSADVKMLNKQKWAIWPKINKSLFHL